MNPKLFAQAIVSIERKYGLRLDAQDVWMRLDGTPCGRGWVGTKPGCKRGKSGESAIGKAPQRAEAASIEPSNKKKGGVACGKGWEGTKPGCKRIKKGGKPEQDEAKTLKAEPKIDPKQQATPQPQSTKPPEKPIKTKVGKSGDVDINKATDEDGSPESFSTTSENGKKIVLIASGGHSPTWAQNDDGVTVSGNKSRHFYSIQFDGLKASNHLIEMGPDQFKAFIEKVRQDPAYDGVEEFRLGDGFDQKKASNKDNLDKLKALESAGLISLADNVFGDQKQAIVNFDSKGKIRKATNAEIESAPLRSKARKLREQQSEKIEEEHASSKLSGSRLKEIRSEETTLAGKVIEAEDKLYGRKNTKTATEAEYIAKAEAWAKSQGFKNDGDGVNGFSAKQAAKHDIAHPATHDLVGLDSTGIHSYFGGLKTASGKKSLLGEEAIVNVMEHLSRGDTLESSVMSGTRVARMLSRDSTKQEREYVRSPKFLQDLNSLAEKSLRSDNFGSISKVIRESNWESGTVTRAGNV